MHVYQMTGYFCEKHEKSMMRYYDKYYQKMCRKSLEIFESILGSCQNVPKVIQKWFQSDSKMTPKWYKIDFKVI